MLNVQRCERASTDDDDDDDHETIPNATNTHLAHRISHIPARFFIFGLTIRCGMGPHCVYVYIDYIETN